MTHRLLNRKLIGGVSLAALLCLTMTVGLLLGDGSIAQAQQKPLGLIPEPPTPSDLNVRVWLPKSNYQIGEYAEIYFNLNQRAYVYILDFDTAGKVNLIYPNKYSQNNQFNPGMHKIPDGSYQLRVSGPAGTEYVEAIASTKKIDVFDFVKYPSDPFRESFPTIPNPEKLKEEITSGLKAGFSLNFGGDDGKPQAKFQLTPVKWDSDYTSFQVGGGAPSNQRPVASYSYSPSNPNTGERVRFDASGSYDRDGYITSYEWDFNGDGRTDATGQRGYNTFVSRGTYNVVLTVQDNDGARSSTTKRVTVGPSNVRPNAQFDYMPTNPAVGERIRFDASDSYDDDGYIRSYEWDLNDDGRTDSSGSIVYHTFQSPGSHTVTLTVEDNQGARVSKSHTIRVSQPQPDFGSSEASSFQSNGTSEYGWYWLEKWNDRSTWTWRSGALPSSAQEAFLNFHLRITNSRGASGLDTSANVRVYNSRGNLIESGSVDLNNPFRPQFSGDTGQVGHDVYGSYEIRNPSSLDRGFKIEVRWPPSNSNYIIGTKSSSITFAYTR